MAEVRDKAGKKGVPGLPRTAKGQEAEKDNDKTVESGQSEYGTFEPATKPVEHDDSAAIWVLFARENPQEFLKIIIDDFSGLRLIQALFVGASIGLIMGTMNKSGDHAAQVIGSFAGISVFCNLLGIVLAFAVTSQCSGMRSMHASGTQVLAALPKLFKLFFVAMLSFLIGMVCIGCAVLVLLSTSQTWAMCFFMGFMAASFLAFVLFVMTSYKFGTSLTTHAAQLALDQLHCVDLEASSNTDFHSLGKTGIHLLGTGVQAAQTATTRKEGDGSEDAPEGNAKESATKAEESAMQEKSEETITAAVSAQGVEEEAASGDPVD